MADGKVMVIIESNPPIPSPFLRSPRPPSSVRILSIAEEHKLNPSAGAAAAAENYKKHEFKCEGKAKTENMKSKQDLRIIKECVAPRKKRARDWLRSKPAGRTDRQKERAERKGKTPAKLLLEHFVYTILLYLSDEWGEEVEQEKSDCEKVIGLEGQAK